MPATVAQLVARVRSRSDSVGSAHVSDAQIAEFLSDACVDLHDLMITTLGEDYLSEQFDATVSTAGVVDFVDLGGTVVVGEDPSSEYFSYSLQPYRLIRVDRLDSANERRPIERLNLSDRVLRDDAAEWRDCTDIRYDWRGTKMYFDPKPTGSQTVRVYYVPAPAILLTSPESCVVYNGTKLTELPWHMHQHERYLIVCAAIAVLDKEESDTRVLLAEKDRIVAYMQNVGPKDVGQPPRVTLEEYDALGHYRL